MANEVNEASLAEVNKLLANGSIAVVIKYSGKLLTLLPFSLTKYFKIVAVVEGYFGLIFNNQPEEMIIVEMGRSSLSKVVCGLEVEVSNTVDEAVDVADTTNKLDEFAVAKGRAEGHVMAEGRAKGHVVAKGQARGRVVAKGRARGQVVAIGWARGQVVAKGRAKGHVAPDNQHG